MGPTTHAMVVGKLIKHTVSCGCGESTDGVGRQCPICGTKVLDVLIVEEPEDMSRGWYAEEYDRFYRKG